MPRKHLALVTIQMNQHRQASLDHLIQNEFYMALRPTSSYVIEALFRLPSHNTSTRTASTGNADFQVG